MLLCAFPASSAALQKAPDPTPTEAFVQRLYVNILGRECDADGLKFWSDSLQNGQMTGSYTALGFIESEEYTSRARSDADFVEDMYLTLLGRASDFAGKDNWVSQLKAGKSRRDIFAGFSNSMEFTSICEQYGIVRGDIFADYDPYKTSQVNLFVERLYRIVLARTCDVPGMSFWTTELLSGSSTGTKTAADFFFSEEYLNRRRTDAEYVADLYNTLLGRAGDEIGTADWTSRLQNGATRLSVLNGFAQSPEFDSICANYGIVRGDAIREDNGKTVCIDPGHSSVIAPGYVPLGPGSSSMKLADASGTSGRWSGLKEYELTMIISNQLKTELESRGYNVIMTRYDNNTPVDCVTRAKIANEGADISVRIHADALSSSSANGAVAICITPHNPWNPQTYAGSRLLADSLINNYCSKTGIRNRGVSEQDDMTGNNWSTVPCVLFEMGFMTNESDDLKMADPNFQVSMVQGLADGIDAYFAAS